MMREKILLTTKVILIVLAVAAMVLAIQPIETLAGKGKGGKNDNNPPPPSSGDTAEGICGADNNGADIVDPQGDSDGDGVSNLCECLGILPGTPCSLPSGSQLIVEGYLSQIPDNALNPVVKSVFVTLARSSDINPGAISHIPWLPQEDATKAFGCLSDPPGPAEGTGGLGANVIVVPYDIAQALPDRWVTNEVKLLWIQEDLTYPTPNNSLGLCENTWGTPNNVGKCYVFTEQAIHDIEAKSGDGNIADNLNGEGFAQVLEHQFINTICHEFAHGGGKLRGLWVYEAGGYHHVVEDLVHDSQFVDHRRKGRTTTFYFGTGFPSPIDVDDFTPWEAL